MKQLQTFDVVVLVVYLAAVVVFGCWFVRRSRTTEGFMAAGRCLPGWAVGLSIFGTYLSSNTFIGVPGKAYAGDFNRFAFSLSLPIAALIAVRYFVPFYRRSGEISAYYHLEKRFGLWARTFAMACYLLMQVARMGSIMLGVALGLNALLDWDMTTIIVATGVLVTLYTLLGGIEAVIWTDVVQSIVLMIGAVMIMVMLLCSMPDGPAQIFSIAQENSKFSLGSFGSSITESTFWVVLVYGLVMNLNNFGIDQNFVQRYHTAKSDRAAARSVWLGALLYLPISLVFFFIGSALFAYYNCDHKEHRELLRTLSTEVAAEKLADDGLAPDQPAYEAELARCVADIRPADIGDKVLPHFIVNRLPSGMAGLLIAAIFAAAMSSIDTSLNSSATIVLSDIYKRHFRRDAGQRESMRVLHLATLAFGALGTGVAVSLIGVKSVLDAWWLLSGIFVGGMLGLFLLGLLSRRSGNFAALAGVTVAMLLTAWIVWLLMVPVSWGWAPSPYHEFLIPVVGTATILLTGSLIGCIVPRPGYGKDASEASVEADR